jgi:hypothetical protein
MAEIPIRTATVDGVNLNLQAAAASDTAKVGAGYSLIVNNASVAEVDVTFAVPGKTEVGVDQPDKIVPVAAGQLRAIPLLDAYADPVDGLAHITWEATASVTRVVLKR